jgi:hypothetical protein
MTTSVTEILECILFVAHALQALESEIRSSTKRQWVKTAIVMKQKQTINFSHVWLSQIIATQS